MTTKTTTIRLDDDTRNALDAACEATGLRQSTLIRLLLKRGLAALEALDDAIVIGLTGDDEPAWVEVHVTKVRADSVHGHPTRYCGPTCSKDPARDCLYPEINPMSVMPGDRVRVLVR